ncbi:T9SS type A sorting domain-containing protein [Candidatus Neomarinimicrobiota bacterium]
MINYQIKITGKKIAILSCILMIVFNSSYLIANPNSDQDEYNILFIGSSYFNFNNLPLLFENIVVGSGKTVYIDQIIPSGLYLADHATRIATETKIYERDWDYIILQGVGRNTAYPEIYTDHPVYPSLVALHNKIYTNYESTKIVFCLPWAFEDGMTWLEGWTDTYEDMQNKIYENTLIYADNIGLMIAPVGWAWKTVLIDKNYPLHYLHMSDWNHPSYKGSYLMACVIFSTIYQENSIDSNCYDSISIDEAVYLQTIGSRIVLDSLELWNIDELELGITNISIPEKFTVIPAYPNPFNPSTTISYGIDGDNRITVKIYNIIGKHVTTLKDGNQSQGWHSVNWNGTNLRGEQVTAGIYISVITSGNELKTSKLILLK